ncbi:MAG: hypothetical protein ACK41P_09330 [Asticcacaulis sp.]
MALSFAIPEPQSAAVLRFPIPDTPTATRPSPGPDLPYQTLRDLTCGERMVIWAFRVHASGCNACPVMVRTFKDLLGPYAEAAFRAFRQFAETLDRTARRPVRVSRPGSLHLLQDEKLLLCLFAAAQAGDPDRFCAHFRFLSGHEPREPFAASAHVFAEALRLRGKPVRGPKAFGLA